MHISKDIIRLIKVRCKISRIFTLCLLALMTKITITCSTYSCDLKDVSQLKNSSSRRLGYNFGQNNLSVDYGDCAATGPRKPKWTDRNAMLRALVYFSKLYKKRLVVQNGGGMRFEHSFALWFMLRQLRPVPKTVIESGSHKGHSAWIIRQALPNARFISLSPENPMITLSNAMYLTGRDFRDFQSIDWNQIQVDPKNSVVIFDDHQSADIRIFDQGVKAGFRRFIYEDNFAYTLGDNLSMRWLCETDGKAHWPGYVLRNFGKQRVNQTWEEHLRQANKLKKTMKHYLEFPPVIHRNMKEYRRATPGLLSNNENLKNIVGDIADHKEEFSNYHYICYVETF